MMGNGNGINGCTNVSFRRVHSSALKKYFVIISIYTERTQAQESVN